MLTPTLSPAPIAPSQMTNTPFTSDNLVSNHTVHRSVPPLSLSAHTIPPVVSSLSSHTISPPVSSLSSRTLYYFTTCFILFITYCSTSCFIFVSFTPRPTHQSGYFISACWSHPTVHFHQAIKKSIPKLLIYST